MKKTIKVISWAIAPFPPLIPMSKVITKEISLEDVLEEIRLYRIGLQINQVVYLMIYVMCTMLVGIHMMTDTTSALAMLAVVVVIMTVLILTRGMYISADNFYAALEKLERFENDLPKSLPD